MALLRIPLLYITACRNPNIILFLVVEFIDLVNDRHRCDACIEFLVGAHLE